MDSPLYRLFSSIEKRHIQWSLKDLRKVEALESRSDFDLIFDKLYRWEAGSESERENFLNILVKLAHRYLGNEQLAKIEFKVHFWSKSKLLS